VTSTTRLGAIVLCGGSSSRMGSSKAWLELGGETLLARAVRRLAGVAEPRVVVAALEQALPELPADVVVVRDRAPGSGPLEGIRAGLAALAGRADAAFVTTTDAPFVAGAFAARLEALRVEAGALAVVPRVHGRLHPLSAVYAPSLLDDVEARVAARTLRVSALAEHPRAIVVDADRLLDDAALRAADPELRSLFNVNTPDAFAAAIAEHAAARDR
jgi:molybdopterin-guanine dinucleotide biosynthesis protein A